MNFILIVGNQQIMSYNEWRLENILNGTTVKQDGCLKFNRLQYEESNCSVCEAGTVTKKEKQIPLDGRAYRMEVNG